MISECFLLSKSDQVTESAIIALGPLYSLLPEEKAAQSTSRAVICLLSAYKRPFVPAYLISQCLAVVLQAAPTHSLQPVLDQILHSLGNMVRI